MLFKCYRKGLSAATICRRRGARKECNPPPIYRIIYRPLAAGKGTKQQGEEG